MEKISIVSDTAYCYIKDGVIYAKELYSEPYELGYIFYNGNEYRFENDEFLDSLEVIEDDDLSVEIKEELIELDEYFFDSLLYLH